MDLVPQYGCIPYVEAYFQDFWPHRVNLYVVMAVLTMVTYLSILIVLTKKHYAIKLIAFGGFASILFFSFYFFLGFMDINKTPYFQYYPLTGRSSQPY